MTMEWGGKWGGMGGGDKAFGVQYRTPKKFSSSEKTYRNVITSDRNLILLNGLFLILTVSNGFSVYYP